MNNQEVVKLFEFAVKEIERLHSLMQSDPKAAVAEIGLDRGLPCNYDDFCNDYFECGKVALRRLYEMAASKLQTIPSLNRRVQVATFLKPIKVEFAKRALMQKVAIDQVLVKAINGLALCPNHHWAMDRFLIAPCPDAKHRAGVWQVGNGLDARIEGQKDLAALKGQRVIPPSEVKFYPALESLTWRQQQLQSQGHPLL